MGGGHSHNMSKHEKMDIILNKIGTCEELLKRDNDNYTTDGLITRNSSYEQLQRQQKYPEYKLERSQSQNQFGTIAATTTDNNDVSHEDQSYKNVISSLHEEKVNLLRDNDTKTASTYMMSKIASGSALWKLQILTFFCFSVIISIGCILLVSISFEQKLLITIGYFLLCTQTVNIVRCSRDIEKEKYIRAFAKKTPLYNETEYLFLKKSYGLVNYTRMCLLVSVIFNLIIILYTNLTFVYKQMFLQNMLMLSTSTHAIVKMLKDTHDAYKLCDKVRCSVPKGVEKTQMEYDDAKGKSEYDIIFEEIINEFNDLLSFFGKKR